MWKLALTYEYHHSFIQCPVANANSGRGHDNAVTVYKYCLLRKRTSKSIESKSTHSLLLQNTKQTICPYVKIVI